MQAFDNPSILDVSELVRPEKKFAQDKLDAHYRVYDESNPLQERVKKTYYEMHTNQTVDFVKKKVSNLAKTEIRLNHSKCFGFQIEKWTQFNHFEATIFEALDKLNDLIDESDPDLDLPNIVHAFQTAEQIRADHPDKEWFQLTGLIHDLGKVRLKNPH